MQQGGRSRIAAGRRRRPHCCGAPLAGVFWEGCWVWWGWVHFPVQVVFEKGLRRGVGRCKVTGGCAWGSEEASLCFARSRGGGSAANKLCGAQKKQAHGAAATSGGRARCARGQCFTGAGLLVSFVCSGRRGGAAASFTWLQVLLLRSAPSAARSAQAAFASRKMQLLAGAAEQRA